MYQRQGGFGKGCGADLFRFYDSARICALWPATRQKFRILPDCGNKTRLQRYIWGKAWTDGLRETPMDQSAESPALRALEDAFQPCSSCRGPSPRLTLAERLDRLARLRAVVADNEARFRAGDLGRFRPSLAAIETNIAETHVGARRDQARHKTSEEMDGAAARCHRAAILPGEKPADAAAARRGRHHRALELSAAADAGARDRRARRRQPRHDQAERTCRRSFRRC